MAEKADYDRARDRARDRSATIEAILALDKRFTREYLNTKTIDVLHDLEDSLINSQYETI